ncbi:MAG: hypothetical protein ACP5HU_13570 [Phycisphaerae bacterium]
MSYLDSVEIHPDTVIGTKGFFRIARATDGRWWFLDPDGRPFVYKGVCAVNRAGTQGGRYARPGPYQETIDAKYGPADDPQPFVDACLEKLRDMKFNALGAWCTEEFFDQGFPYTEILECRKIVPASQQLEGPGIKLPDVFDPAWETAVDDIARKLCTPRRDRTDLVGYFTDNEMGWGQAGTDYVWGASEEMNRTEGEPTLLQFCLSQPEERPAAAGAWEFVMGKYGSLAELSRSWGVEVSARDDLRELTRRGIALDSPGYGADHEEFSTEFAERYFQVTADAIRRYDPNHLILGCRYGAPPGEPILRATRRPWVDVLSANNYRDVMYERVDEYHAPTDMPVLIGEFSWASDYFRRVTDRTRAVEKLDEDTRIAVLGAEALERTFTHPAVVGYTWYRWVNRHEDTSRPTGALVNCRDEVNTFNAEMLRRIHPRLDGIAAGELEPTTIEAQLNQLG